MPRRWRPWLAAIPVVVGVAVAVALGHAVATRHGCITILRGGWCTHFLGQRSLVGGVLWALVPVAAGLLAALWIWKTGGADR